jgi:hypothetical protein
MAIDDIHSNDMIVPDIGIIAVVEDLTMKVNYQSVRESHMVTGGTGTVPMETNVTQVLSKISTIDIDTRDPADKGNIAKLQNTQK